MFAGVEDVRTHDPVERREYVDFLDAACGYDPAGYFKTLRDVNAPALDFLNVRYLVSSPGRSSPGPKWKSAYSGADGTVFENSQAFPRVFPADPSATLAISRYRESTNRVAFHSRAPGNRFVLAEASLVQDGGWSARDEAGRKLSVTRVRGPSPGARGFGLAGGPFLGVAIPPGDHDLFLDYSPPGFRAGADFPLGPPVRGGRGRVHPTRKSFAPARKKTVSAAFRRFLLAAAIAGIALVVGFRTAEQLKSPGALTARSERLWYGWAYRDPALLARLESSENRFRPGEGFCLEFDSRRIDPTWLQAMTNYAYWRELPAGACPSAPVGTAGPVRIAVSESGDVAVVRGAPR